MNKRVDELLKETMDLHPPKLLSSLKEVNIFIQKGEQYQSTFRVGTAGGQKLRGKVCSDNHRIVFAEDGFNGSSCSVVYGIDTYGLDEGDEISGNMFLMTDIGELTIPVYAVIEDKLPEAYEKIKNLDGFVKLAGRNFREAFLMYTNDDFTRILKGKNSRFITLYRGLSQNPVTYQHLEEFLIAAGKKEPVHLTIDKSEKVSYVLNSSIKDTLYIYKSTWGYTYVEVQSTADFIEIDKKAITSDNFIGKVYGLEFVLNRDKLKGRICKGKIILKTVHETIEVEIEASPFAGMELVSSKFRKLRTLKLIQSFLKLQLKKMDYRTWYDSSKQWLEEIKEEHEDFFTLFIEAYLASCSEDKKKLIELLWPIKTGEIKPEEPWQKAVYLFLAKEAGILPNEDQKIAPDLYALYQKAPEDYLILELYLKDLEAHGYNSPWGLAELEKVYERGCRSPFLYFRAWDIIRKQESLLRKLSPFMIRVILFAQKEGVITESLLLRTAFLSANVKKFYPTLYKILSEGYEKYGKRELLEAVCRHIMNDNPASPAYFKWYEKAVEEDLRLTRLYEYYIETRPEDLDTPLPMAIKLYFSYNTTISERKKAYLYSAIVKEKESDPISFENYEKVAKEFAAAGLKKGRINEFYAVLYREFYPDLKDAETAGYMAEILFTHRITCRDSKIRRVIVCHPALRDIQSYALNDGAAYPKIYSKNACIFFEDEKKRRFASTVEYKMEQLLNVDKLAKTCMLFGIWDTGMQLYCCHEKTWQMDINSKNIMSFWKAAENLYFTREYRDKTRKKLLDYFNKHADEWSLMPFSESLKELTYGHLDKSATFEMLVQFGQYKKAFNLITRQGFEGINAPLLLKLAVDSIKAKAYENDEELLDLAYHIYRSGFFNDDILEYISKNGVSNLEETEKIWKDMTSFGMDTFEMEEKYLLRSMFVRKMTENSDTIFQNYSRKGGKPYIRAAYLIYLAMQYVLIDRKLTEFEADRLKEKCQDEEDPSLFCKIAWLKYKSEHSDTLAAGDKKLIRAALEECDRQGVKLEFFKKLPADIIKAFSLDDKVFAEEKVRSGSKVVIHYKIETAGSKDVSWKDEPLKESITGLYVREFLLFFGETLSYYSTVTTAEDVFDTPVRKLSIAESDTKGKTRYQLLNRMLMQTSLGAGEKAEKTMERYLWQEAFADNMFKIID